MTVTLAHNAQPIQLWTALDIDEKWRVGRLITEQGKRFIVQNGKKFQVKSNHTPKAYR
jgi:hypothetical protein